MTYRYSSIDIIVGVGMCAIVFGALLLVFATSGSFLAPPLPVMPDQFSGQAAGMAWLQPALGQAIVERTLLQRQSDRVTAQATLEWDQALLSHYSLQSLPGGPFGSLMARAATIAENHAARVQTVMGRSIVNATRRAVRSGALAEDYSHSGYNRTMIGAAERWGERMDSEFVATWQPLLGRWIVEASLAYGVRAAGVQEQLGRGILHMAQARTGLEEAWAANQYQLGTLLTAVDRAVTTNAPDGPIRMAESTVVAGSLVPEPAMGLAGIPLGYFLVALFGMAAIFFAGLQISAKSRESKAQADLRRDRERWVYRLAA